VLAELFTGYVLFQSENIQGMLARMQAILGSFPEDLLLFGTETTKYFTSALVVYRREGGEEGRVGGYEEGDGAVSLLHPKKSNLAARIRTDDALFLDFIRALLSIHPDQRPTAAEALNHPWLM